MMHNYYTNLLIVIKELHIYKDKKAVNIMEKFLLKIVIHLPFLAKHDKYAVFETFTMPAILFVKLMISLDRMNLFRIYKNIF